MKPAFRIFALCSGLLIFFPGGYTDGQILTDTAAVDLVKKCMTDIYDFRFAGASEECDLLNVKYPGNPVIYLINGMILYWKNFPLLAKSSASKTYIADMEMSIRLSDKKKSRDQEAEYLLINLCARGMLLQFYADIDYSSEVIPLATSTYPRIRQSFKYTSNYNDFYFFTGLYNYYREAYPEAYPIYKAFAFLFPKGDKAEGIRQMQIAGERSLFLRAESYSFLSWICTNFERDFERANEYSKILYDLYPGNDEYLSEYIRNLLLIKSYAEAEKLISLQSKRTNNPYFNARLEIFNGILQEKKYNDINQARQLYEQGLSDIAPYKEYGNEYAAYAYFGLGRISGLNGDRKGRKMYHKKATELAVFKNVDFNN